LSAERIVAVDNRVDVVVVGTGNAGAVRGLACARDRRLGRSDRRCTTGVGRRHLGVHGRGLPVDLRVARRPAAILDLDDEQAARIDLDPYTVDDFRADITRVTAGRTDRLGRPPPEGRAVRHLTA
jgi:hypothetical protein